MVEEEEVGVPYSHGGPVMRRSHSFDEVLFDFRSVSPEDIAVW